MAVPEIRFQGFSGEWEEKSLGNVLLVQRGGSPRPIENFITTSSEGINWIKIGDVNTESRYITSTKEKIIPEGEKKSRRVLVGDLILSNSMSFGRPYIMKIDGCIHDGWLLIRDTNELFDIEYLLQLLSSSFMLRQYRSMAAGGVVINLNSDLVQSTIVLLPDKSEQSQIGTFFQNLDAQITQHQRKLSKLGAVKKAMLTKMFPQEGSAVPEIRFQGFTGEWERKTLGEITKISSSKRVHLEDYVESGIPFFRGSEISKLGCSTRVDDILYISESHYLELKEKYGVPKIGDILITAVGTLGNLFLVTEETPFYFKDGNLIWLSDIRINSEYLNVFLQDGIGKRKLLESAAGSNQKAITMVKLQNIQISVPDSTEQKIIATFFQNLDSLISLQQRELDKLKNIKKACLEKMFV